MRTYSNKVKSVLSAGVLRTSIKKVRIRSLDAKISALKDIHANPDAHPWNEDN